MNVGVEILKKAADFPVNTIYWDHGRLTHEEQQIRNFPAPWLFKTLDFLSLIKDPVVVEIGSTRFGITQKCIDYYNSCFTMTGADRPACCQDGHSTYFWARAGSETYTVDIDPRCADVVRDQYIHHLREDPPANLHVHIPADGIEFLRNFDKEINLLYLDGWDVGSLEYAERHLEAFKAAEDKLAPNHIVSIDDTDFVHQEGGKDKLLTPYLLENGYIRVLHGRQTVFIKLA